MFHEPWKGPLWQKLFLHKNAIHIFIHLRLGKPTRPEIKRLKFKWVKFIAPSGPLILQNFTIQML